MASRIKDPVDFQFKQFGVRHDRCAMKVGTDGVLVAAWSRMPSGGSNPMILDAGSGSGVIALIAAQRCAEAMITAVEIEGSAAEQSRENFAASPWPDRLHIHNTSLQEFASAKHFWNAFDLIISNPPFFASEQHYAAHGYERHMARMNHHLELEELIDAGENLLKVDGRMSIILPLGAATDLNLNKDLLLTRRTLVRPIHGKPHHRILLELTKSNNREDHPLQENELTIQQSQVRNHFTDEYIRLVKDFYIKM